MSRGSWEESPVKAGKLSEWVQVGTALNHAILVGFDRRYGEMRVASGDYPEAESKFLDTAAVLMRALVAARSFVQHRYKAEDDVHFDPFLDWLLGSSRGCFDDWAKLDWVTVNWEGGTMTMTIDELDRPQKNTVQN
jgi:hypothetical protein